MRGQGHRLVLERVQRLLERVQGLLGRMQWLLERMQVLLGGVQGLLGGVQGVLGWVQGSRGQPGRHVGINNSQGDGEGVHMFLAWVQGARGLLGPLLNYHWAHGGVLEKIESRVLGWWVQGRDLGRRTNPPLPLPDPVLGAAGAPGLVPGVGSQAETLRAAPSTPTKSVLPIQAAALRLIVEFRHSFHHLDPAKPRNVTHRFLRS